MSSLIVEVTKIDEILPHDNADSLELAKVKGWICIVKKGSFKPGDKCIYVPIDSVLPQELEIKLFEGAKIKLDKGRIKTIKLRGYISQGLIIDPKAVNLEDKKVGTDVKDLLGIKKYEPPKRREPHFKGGQVRKRECNPNFKKYTDIENFKNYNNIFGDGEIVCITEKIHGTNWRAGYVPVIVDSLWKRIKKFFNLLPKYEFVYGSRNVQLKLGNKKGTYYQENVYLDMVNKYDIRNVLKEGEVVYAECYGDGIQSNYCYGCKSGERKIAVFDIMINETFLDPDSVKRFCIDKNLPYVPMVYYGFFNPEFLAGLSRGNSLLAPEQKIREGIVIKPHIETYDHRLGRKILKYINDDYLLLKNNTDFH